MAALLLFHFSERLSDRKVGLARSDNFRFLERCRDLAACHRNRRCIDDVKLAIKDQLYMTIFADVID